MDKTQLQELKEHFDEEPLKVSKWFRNYINGKFYGTTWDELDQFMAEYQIDEGGVLDSLLLNKECGQWGFEPKE
jgi:hypothetical protein|tara:strand:+ start:682 stop:903 length:222 start_codon:yes stop_codon:yes gene_type:complete